MTLVTLKAGSKGRNKKVASLIQKAKAQAASSNDRVLVVYGEDAASIYFEGEGPKSTVPSPPDDV
jgi:hypothetical protein